jgi:hypothetical protein
MTTLLPAPALIRLAVNGREIEAAVEGGRRPSRRRPRVR